jgi:2,4-diketo-3-deoxy-L-fuconate hydrolase
MSFGLATLRDGGAALVVGDRVIALAPLGEGREVLALLDDWDAAFPKLEALAATGEGATVLDETALAAPYIPRQIFCTGANYRKHVIGLIMGDPSMRTPGDEDISDEERRARAEKVMDERARATDPYCFIKLPSCVVGPNDAVVLPRNVVKPDWELELGGFAVVNDVTAREHIFRRDAGGLGADWLSGKCFPTFLPFGPMIVPRQFVADPYDLTIRLAVNGKVYQDESTRDMMIGIERQIAYLSDRVELMPGDVICTGSPYGNGSAFGIHLQPGDLMEGSITGLGTQRNPCVAER